MPNLEYNSIQRWQFKLSTMLAVVCMASIGFALIRFGFQNRRLDSLILGNCITGSILIFPIFSQFTLSRVLVALSFFAWLIPIAMAIGHVFLSYSLDGSELNEAPIFSEFVFFTTFLFVLLPVNIALVVVGVVSFDRQIHGGPRTLVITAFGCVPAIVSFALFLYYL